MGLYAYFMEDMTMSPITLQPILRPLSCDDAFCAITLGTPEGQQVKVDRPHVLTVVGFLQAGSDVTDLCSLLHHAGHLDAVAPVLVAALVDPRWNADRLDVEDGLCPERRHFSMHALTLAETLSQKPGTTHAAEEIVRLVGLQLTQGDSLAASIALLWEELTGIRRRVNPLLTHVAIMQVARRCEVRAQIAKKAGRPPKGYYMGKSVGRILKSCSLQPRRGG